MGYNRESHWNKVEPMGFFGVESTACPCSCESAKNRDFLEHQAPNGKHRPESVKPRKCFWCSTFG